MKHDFANRGEPQRERAKDAIVDAVLDAIDHDFEVADKAERERYRGWGG